MTSPVQLPPRTTVWLRPALATCAVVTITILSCTPALGGVEIDIDSILRNWSNGAERLGKMLRPDWSILPRTGQPLVETLAMAVTGAALSALCALPLTLWAAKPTNPHAITRTVVRSLLNIIRSIPNLVYATILVAMVGVGTLPGVISLVLFDVGIVVKLVSESIESADNSYIEAGHAAGATQTQINRVTVLPQMLASFTSQMIYALELNVRISAILGLVGAGGIGLVIDEVRGYYRYDALAAIILELLLIVLVLEVVSVNLRKRLR
ncbi:phosphonate ABC transporter, permease protein PhnE [Corynebacterium sp. H127]|uniref:phosphonate ABC transporter, permease protein PhnE n=1 Tax=Corynebacterium sp. H127 TaxID=3133418 RepID=UPI0030A51E99